jgi:hypothetical protein
VAQQATTEPRQELLSWENLSGWPAGTAFRRSLAELLVHPGRFFGKMSLSGGLFEPLTFFAVVLGLGLVVAFPAALVYLQLAAPDPERLGAAAYAAALMPARATGLLLVLLPLALAVACGLMVLLGTVFHAGAKPFGARNWEGSVSLWLYTGGAALTPSVAAVAFTFAVSLAGWLLALLWPETRGSAQQIAAWTGRILIAAGLLAGAVLVVLDAAVGCVRAYGLEPVLGAAAAVAGLVAVGIAAGSTVWAFGHVGAAVGTAVGAGWTCAATVGALLAGAAAERAEESD